eukprot:TRINITY_DN458_c0_g1_i6.p1 TRINITY_DN458_c0_g1~~TRINITY_DN458_c0_g1_i6.p1  ORF type:complete len:769 (+),score=227.54 TRINITY_DN458_c0_g1_i6:54-2309(+)
MSKMFSSWKRNNDGGGGGRFKTTGGISKSDVSEELKVFECPLEKGIELATEDAKAIGVPDVVYDCIEYLTANGLQTEGVFRIPGAQNAINELKRRYDSGEIIKDIDNYDPFIVAGTLKLYFRELSDPVVPFSMYQSFIDAHRLSDDIQRYNQLSSLVKALPEQNFRVLQYLVHFLYRLCLYASVNKMTQQNISTCIAPGLIRGEDQDIATIFRDAPNANGIVQLMIERFPYMFSVDVSEDERQCKRFFSNGEEEEEFESDGNDKQGDDNGNDKQQETNNNNNNKNSNLDSDDDKTFRRKSDSRGSRRMVEMSSAEQDIMQQMMAGNFNFDEMSLGEMDASPSRSRGGKSRGRGGRKWTDDSDADTANASADAEAGKDVTPTSVRSTSNASSTSSVPASPVTLDHNEKQAIDHITKAVVSNMLFADDTSAEDTDDDGNNDTTDFTLSMRRPDEDKHPNPKQTINQSNTQEEDGPSTTADQSSSSETAKVESSQETASIVITEDVLDYTTLLLHPLDYVSARIKYFREQDNRPSLLEDMTDDDLQREKSIVKRELRSYDIAFEDNYKVAPTKADKEVLRPIYSWYRQLKSKMSNVEKAKKSQPSSSIPSPSASTPTTSSSSSSSTTTSSDDNTESDKQETCIDVTNGQQSEQKDNTTTGSSSSTAPANNQDQEEVRDSLLLTRTYDSEIEELADLKKEKKMLQIKLHAFQQDFLKKHGRKVKFLDDQMPMSAEYQRYKALKKRIAELEGNPNQ